MTLSDAVASRQEQDSLGPVAVPVDQLWGAQTQRSLRYFPFGQRMPLAIVHAFGQLKAACAEVNGEVGRLDPALVAEGAGACEAAVLEALQAAYETSTGTMKSRMEELTGGLNLNLPGLGG